MHPWHDTYIDDATIAIQGEPVVVRFDVWSS